MKSPCVLHTFVRVAVVTVFVRVSVPPVVVVVCVVSRHLRATS
jgi:hypothetical protein